MNYIVWGSWLALFCVLEGLAVFWAGCPWNSFSRTIWDLQVKYGAPVTLGVLFVLGVLIAHLVRSKNLSEGDRSETPKG